MQCAKIEDADDFFNQGRNPVVVEEEEELIEHQTSREDVLAASGGLNKKRRSRPAADGISNQQRKKLKMTELDGFKAPRNVGKGPPPKLNNSMNTAISNTSFASTSFLKKPVSESFSHSRRTP